MVQELLAVALAVNGRTNNSFSPIGNGLTDNPSQRWWFHPLQTNQIVHIIIATDISSLSADPVEVKLQVLVSQHFKIKNLYCSQLKAKELNNQLHSCGYLKQDIASVIDKAGQQSREMLIQAKVCWGRHNTLICADISSWPTQDQGYCWQKLVHLRVIRWVEGYLPEQTSHGFQTPKKP